MVLSIYVKRDLRGIERPAESSCNRTVSMHMEAEQ